MTAAADDDWAAEAMAEDSLVVEVLLRLKRSTRRRDGKLAADLAPVGWGARQPRSASAAAASGSKSVVVMASECRRESKERIGRRGRGRSPSTPLSWSGGSGGGGGGGGVDGCETCSPPTTNRSPISRSKITLTGSEVNGASSSKARKKKTHAELREEEDMLLKERMHLNRELAMLEATVMEQRAENENLKRIKLDLSTQLMKKNQRTAAAAGGPEDAQNMQASTKASSGHDCVPSALTTSRPNPSSASCEAESDTILPARKRANFMLPDLNMLPTDLDSTS